MNDDVMSLARPVFDAVMSGRYAYGAVLALVLLVAIARRYGSKAWPFLGGDAGGSALALVGSFAGALATAMAAGAGITGSVMWTALTIALAAAGGFSLIKKLIVNPLLRPWSLKAPAWAAPIFAAIFWIFDRPATEAAPPAGKTA